MLTDAAHYHFSFAAGSPAPVMGIKSIDYAKAGFTDDVLIAGTDS